MHKPNYCESCKFQFRSKDSLLLHISQTHADGPKSVEPPRIPVKIMSYGQQFLWYLKASEVIRDNFCMEKHENGSVFIKDPEKFSKLEPDMQRRVHEAMQYEGNK